MAVAAIGLGSNLSDAAGREPCAVLDDAVERLRRLGSVEAVSHWRQTMPEEVLEQPSFTNGAALLRTELSPQALLAGMMGIEAELGRVRLGALRKGPRVVDLDLLLYDELVLNGEELTLPHPMLHRRRFVLEPLAEIGPELRHPVLGQTMEALWMEFCEGSAMERV